MSKALYTSLLLIMAGAINGQTPVDIPRSPASPVALPGIYNNVPINYVRSWEPSMSTSDSATVASPLRTVTEVKQSTDYFDGLGRPVQAVVKGLSPTGKDLVATRIYDQYGREQYKYLPYSSQITSTGKFRSDPFTEQKLFFSNSTLMPGSIGESIYYGKVDFEGSPLNRPLRSYAAGNSWAKKDVATGENGGNRFLKNSYEINSSTDSVRIWTIAPGGVVPTSTAVYTAGQLYKNSILNEAGNQVIEYKDKNGRAILKKIQLSPTPGTAHIGWLCTYYVYDDKNNLRMVVPPKAIQAINATWVLSTDVVKELCFLYRYDGRGRLIVKKVPGADSTEMVYDVRDRLVFTRDGNMKGTSWLVNYYDALNRPAQVQLYAAATDRASLQTSMSSIVTGNPLPNLPAAALTPLVLTFYNDYSFAGKQNYATEDIGKLQAGTNLYSEALPAAPSSKTRGMVTGTRVRILGTNQWLTTTNYYNDKGRLIQTVSDNISGGIDVVNNLYDFSGKLLSSYVNHKNPKSITAPQIRILTMISYDAAGRVINIKKRLNDVVASEKTISVSTYNELGQLQTKRLGVTATGQLETLKFDYTIRGWLKGVNKDYANTDGSTSNWFGEDLVYDYGFTLAAQFNGDIAGSRWKSKSNGVARLYSFGYDKSSRMTSADFLERNGTVWGKTTMDFTVSNLTYDVNGNIATMNQMGKNGSAAPALIDQLTYTYRSNSNKLAKVADPINTVTAKLGDFNNGANTTDDYDYDANGNLIKDENKKITLIRYNYLNLPDSIVFTGKGNIVYRYDASGNKVKKIVTDISGGVPKITTTDYIGNFVYRNDTLQYTGHEEGRIRAVIKTGQPVSYWYDYFVKDHLGNIRVVLTDQTDLSVYSATMETENAPTETSLFSNIDNTRASKPVGYPSEGDSTQNLSVSKLAALNGSKKIGPSLVLRVMAGDTFRIKAKAFYKSIGPVDKNEDVPLSENMLADLVQAFGGNSQSEGTHGVSGSAPTTPFNTDFYNDDYQRLKQKDADEPNSNRPKAYLNFVLFDDQFKLVDENSGVRQVKAAPDELQALGQAEMVATKSGFLYVYTSNESAQDVFFDNVAVALASGPLLEETHYYPFGLAIASISSNALRGTNYPENKIKFNGRELQDKEFADGVGLEWYDYKNRFYDTQLGRFFVSDPLADKFPYYSTYQFAGNEVPNAIDVDGLEPWYTRDGSLATGMSGPYDPAVMNQRGLYTAAQIQQMKNAPPPDPKQATLRQMMDCPQCAVNAKKKADEDEYQRRLWETQEGQSFGIVSAGVEMAAWEYAGVKAAKGIGYLASGLGRGSVWTIAPSARGFTIERILGGNLPENFPVIDKLSGGVATSIKSIDLTMPSYQKSSSLFSKLKGYINQLDNFTDARWDGVAVTQGVDYTSKTLEIAIQPGKATLDQWEAIGKAIEYGNKQGVGVKIRFLL
ncbi:DUF6443 domain-containing protein [Chitinophaga sp. RCC_12]|uniref:DUF6443 domain-containing protein n=1 Tax=Chitinophaga sp. RCC_12 TaxID=3239226 RepID=UPI003524A29E